MIEKNLYQGLIFWMEFEETDSILLLGKAREYKSFFLNLKCQVCSPTLHEVYTDRFIKDYTDSFDYIIGIEILEIESNPEQLLCIVKGLLRSKGKLLLGTDNRIGLRYFCGDIDPFTQRCFDGLDNYNLFWWGEGKRQLSGKCYTKKELRSFLSHAGFRAKFYSVFPILEKPQLIIAEDFCSSERIAGRYTPVYRNPDTILFPEEQLCDDFTDNNALHAVANAFWIECSLDNCFMDVKQITLSDERGEENAYATIIHSKEVEKIALFEKGKENLKKLEENMETLQKRGILTVSGIQNGKSYVMPYVSAILGNVYLRNLLITDLNKFIACMDHFRDLILCSSDYAYEDEQGVILKYGYVDMIPLNCFYLNEEFVFFDQEFCVENYPANAILYRSIVVVYERMAESDILISKEDLLERYGLKPQWKQLHQITTDFIYNLRRQRESALLNDMHMRNEWMTNYNRSHLNNMINNLNAYNEYRYRGCFEEQKDKRFLLFGSGKWCDIFLGFYLKNYKIGYILDNDESKWGTERQGISIVSPDCLLKEQGKFKVVICAKDYKPIFRQLKRMQIEDIGIYDANYDVRMREEKQHEIEKKNYLENIHDKMDFYEEYRRNNCFEELYDKRIYLFGAGKWCDKFLAFYKNDYTICGILDNDESKWGAEMHGIPIISPDKLHREKEAYKVIICAKKYKPIFRQLKKMQVTHIGIYDANYFYPGRQTLNIIPSKEEGKKYRIGYMSGTFDLFHIGHINMLKRAKEQCEYLIVAVTSDEYVRNRKKKEPVIPFLERLEVVKSCKYVDEAVGVPVNYAGTVEAFQKYHFDCQFCGSDCENNVWWLEQKKFLQDHGSDLVFFPYTEQTSSTKIRALIDKGLL